MLKLKLVHAREPDFCSSTIVPLTRNMIGFYDRGLSWKFSLFEKVVLYIYSNIRASIHPGTTPNSSTMHAELHVDGLVVEIRCMLN